MLYCLVFSHILSLLYLITSWKKQPLGELFIRFGLTPPPCCLVDNPQVLSNKNNNTTIGIINNNNKINNNNNNNNNINNENNKPTSNPLNSIKERI